MAPLQQHHFSLQHKDTIRNGYYCRSVEIICSLLWSIHIFANKGEKCWGSSSWKYGSVQLTVPHQFFCSSNSSLFSNAQQDPLNFTAVTSADIQEMEHVREHLHSMLKNARSFLENDDFDATQSNATGMKTGSLDPNVCSTSSLALFHVLGGSIIQSVYMQPLQARIHSSLFFFYMTCQNLSDCWS